MSATAIKAKDTPYKGHLFRSRLEARFAVFFDALGITWQYEPEGFDLPDGTSYLPDFWLPNINTWLEVKGPEPSIPEREKCRQLSLAFGGQEGDPLLPALCGGREALGVGRALLEFAKSTSPATPDREVLQGLASHLRGAPKVFLVRGLFEKSFLFTGAYDIEMREADGMAPWLFTESRPNFLKAVNSARSARFEHGESGARA
mgnify:CR=1 FL=1